MLLLVVVVVVVMVMVVVVIVGVANCGGLFGGSMVLVLVEVMLAVVPAYL